MKRFMAGAIVAVVIIAAGVLVWYGLDDQARGIVVGVLLGVGGLATGVLLALAAVAILLLINLRWTVSQNAKPPIVLPGAGPPARPQSQWYPPQLRAPRQWGGTILGVEDVEAALRESIQEDSLQ